MKRISPKAPAFSATLGLTLDLAACGNGIPAASGRTRTPLASGATAGTSTPPTTTAPPSSSAPSATASHAATSSSTLPAVVADCTSNNAPSVRPATITLACADNGMGVEKMNWTDWTASSATGQGKFWENLCQPNCATGKISTYPVMVTLSVVKTSPLGPWLSQLNIVWEGAKPSNQTPDQFGLLRP